MKIGLDLYTYEVEEEPMEKLGVCVHCRKEYLRNPRVKHQEYCGSKVCQRARRRRWQREKLKGDDAYRENQARCQKQWQARNPGYYKYYRATHPEYEERNRSMQFLRDNRVKSAGDRSSAILAKMDSLLGPYYRRNGSRFKLYVQGAVNLAKMDALTVRLVPF